MKRHEDTLDRLDEYFAKKKESEKWLIILVVSGILGYVLYLYLFPYAESKYKASLSTKKTLEKKIAEEKTYLSSITVNGDRNFKVKKFNREIAKKKKRIQAYHRRIALLNQSFRRLSEVLFNQENWSKFLDSITQRAQENGVQLLEIRNKYVKEKGNFGHVLEMEILCSGKFQGILSFLNDLEQNKLVTDVYKSQIGISPEEGAIMADLHVSVWGVNR